MKKLLIAVMSVGAILAATAFTTPQAKTELSFDCNHGQCVAIKSNGYRCRNCAQEGSRYCWSHRPN